MTDTNQLPPLPTMQPGDSHMESLIEAAIQGHADTREAMRWLVRQLVPATQPAEVTDDLVEKATVETFQKTGADLIPEVAATFARAILALRPVQVPMTEWQPIETAPLAGPFLAVLDCGGDQTICTMRHGVVASKNSRPDGEFIRERVTHWMPLPPLPKSTYTGITAQAKKETP